MDGTSGNSGLDALADAIAARVVAKIQAAQEPAYIGAKEIARRLGRSLRSVHHLAKMGQIPSIRQGRRVMFSWHEVQSAIEEKTIP